MVQVRRSPSVGTVTTQDAINHTADQGNAIARASTVAIARAIAVTGAAVVDRPIDVAAAVSTAAGSGNTTAAGSGNMAATGVASHCVSTMTMGS